MITGARDGAARAAAHPAVRTGARVGFAANGVLNALIGWIALQLAVGDGTQQEASASGALRTLAGTTGGAVLLWVLLVGFALLGLWNLTTAFLGGETSDRLKAAGKGVTYLVLGGLTVSVLTGAGSGGQGTAGVTATLMQQPFGRVLVGVVGLGVLGVGAYQVVKGWRKRFLQDLREQPPSWAVHAGRAGYVARGVAFGIVGGLFLAAAATADPQEAQGLDGALQTLREAPFGRVLLAVVAVGFVAFGVYSVARARYARV